MYPKHSSVHLKTWTLSQFFLPNNFEKAEFILTNFNLNLFMLVSLKSTYNHSSFCVITKTIILRMYPFKWHLKCTPLRSPMTYCVHMYVCFSWSCHRNPDTFMMALRTKHQIGREQAVGFLFLSLSNSLAHGMHQALFLLTDCWASGSRRVFSRTKICAVEAQQPK